MIEPATYQVLKVAAEAHEGSPDFRVDLPSASVVTPDGDHRPFAIPASRAQALMRGDDEIALTLQHGQAIEDHYLAVRTASDWLFPATLERSTTR